MLEPAQRLIGLAHGRIGADVGMLEPGQVLDLEQEPLGALVATTSGRMI